MDCVLSQVHSRWQDRTRGVCDECAKPPRETDALQRWLKETVAKLRAEGIFDCAVDEGDTGPDLLSLSLVARQLATVDVGLAVAFVNRSLCYRSCQLFSRDRKCLALSNLLRELDDPMSAVLSIAAPAGNIAGQPERARAYAFSTAQSSTRFFLHWAPCEGDGEDVAFLIFELDDGISDDVNHATAFESLPMHRHSIRRPLDSPAAVIGRLDYFEWAGLIEATRGLLLAAAATGLLSAIAGYVFDYSQRRMSFGKPLCQHQAVALRLADIAISRDTTRLMLWDICDPADQCSEGWLRRAGAFREYCFRLLADVAQSGCRLLAGHGFIADHPLASWHRECQVLCMLGAYPHLDLL
jgi:hypothetical protein